MTICSPQSLGKRGAPIYRQIRRPGEGRGKQPALAVLLARQRGLIEEPYFAMGFRVLFDFHMETTGCLRLLYLLAGNSQINTAWSRLA